MLMTMAGIIVVFLGLAYSNPILMIFGTFIGIMDFFPSLEKKPKAKAEAEPRKGKHIVLQGPPPEDNTMDFMMAMGGGHPAAWQIRKTHLEAMAKEKGVSVDDLKSEVVAPHDFLPFEEPHTTNPLRNLFIGFPNFLKRKIFSGTEGFKNMDHK